MISIDQNQTKEEKQAIYILSSSIEGSKEFYLI